MYVSILVVVLSVVIGWVYNELVKKPKSIGSKLKKQGITGPTPKIFIGNLLEMQKSRDDASAASSPINPPVVEHNYSSTLFPFLHQWKKQYGDVFLFYLGLTPTIHVTNFELLKEISTNTSLGLGRPLYLVKTAGPLLGRGIVTSNGSIWDFNRRIIAPELYRHKVKGMITTITDSVNTLVNAWKNLIAGEGDVADIKIDEYMEIFSGEVVSRVCFGSNYVEAGQQILSKLKALTTITSTKLFYTWIPGIRYLATGKNKELWALDKQVRKLIHRVIDERNDIGQQNLLQMILEAAKNSEMDKDSIDNFIIDNSKNIFLSVYDTLGAAATWCLMLLASNLEWQERVRAEIHQVCKGQLPNHDMIHKMKLLTMVIYEALRLYPAGPIVSRETLEDMKLGDFYLPKGVVLWILLPMIHTDPEIWGQDSYKFDPNRFANGVAASCKMPHMYMPFGAGLRICPGQNFGLVTLKILITQILSNFSLSLSPKYKHSPAHKVVIVPKYGVNLLVKSCDLIKPLN